MSVDPQIFDFPDSEFYAELDKITSPRPCLDADELLRRERQKTEKLRTTLLKFQTSTASLLELYKTEQAKNKGLEADLKKSNDELSVQKQNFIELENSSLNKLHFQEQIIEEFRSQKRESSEDHVQLAKEYLGLLSEITRYHNYAIDKKRIKMVRKVENFMREEDPTFKAKIVKSRPKKNGSVSDYETDSLCSESTNSSAFRKKSPNSATDDWDRLSVSSIKSFDTRFDDSMLNSPSSEYSVEMNKKEDSDIPNFIISENKKVDPKTKLDKKPKLKKESPETSMFKTALFHNYCLKDKSPPKPQRKSHNLEDTSDFNITELNPEIEEIIDQNLEKNEDLEDMDYSTIFQSFSQEEIIESTENVVITEVRGVPPIIVENTLIQEATESEGTSNKLCNCQNSQKIVVTKSIATNTDNRFLQLPDCPILDDGEEVTSTNTVRRPTSTKSTSTDPMKIERHKVRTEDRGTSPIKINTRDQAVTVKFPSVTRGTTTESPKSKSIGLNFPEPAEFSVNQILEEMQTNLLDLLEPIAEVKHTLKSTACQTSPVKRNSIKTNTDIQNIRKRLDYVVKDESLLRIKKEQLSPASSLNNLFFPRVSKADRSLDDQEFSIIGHVMYDIYVDLIQQRNSLSRNDVVSKILEGLNRFRQNFSLSPDSGMFYFNQRDFKSKGLSIKYDYKLRKGMV